MEFKQRTLMALADMICGNFKTEESFFVYRSSSHLTRFFQDCDTEYVHDGSTRNYWVADTLKKILAEPHPNSQTPPFAFSSVISALMDPVDALMEGPGVVVTPGIAFGAAGAGKFRMSLVQPVEKLVG